MRITHLGYLLAFASVLVACGGDDDNVDCSAFTACGGEVAGTWRYAGSCGEFTDPSCPGAVTESEPSISGTFTFDTDGTYTSMGTVNGTSRTRIPGSCLTGLSSCGDLSVDGEPCTGDIATACVCETVYDNEQQEENGTWMTSGNDITIDGDTSGYCVSGGTLRIEVATGVLIVLQR